MGLRVAYLCGEYPRATDTFIQREIAALRSEGVEVETISVRRPQQGEAGTAEQEGERQRTHYMLPCSPWRLLADHSGCIVRAPVRYLKALRTAVCVRSPGIKSLAYQFFYFAEAGLVATELRRRRVSHIHSHAPDASGYVTMLAAEIGGLTFSMTLHGFGALSEPSRWRLREKLERSLFAVCVSSWARGQAMLWTDSSHWGKYHVVHCGIDPAQFQPRTHDQRGKRILFIGRFDPVKGLPLLIEAIERLAADHPDVHLDLVGDGPLRPEIERQIRERRLDGGVTSHGYLSQAQCRERLCEADVLVISSFAEGVPVVLMEAMASGVPVLAPWIAGIPELVENGVSGVLVPSGDVESLASGLSMLLTNPALRSRLAQAGRLKVEREFNTQLEATRLIHIFRERLAGRNVEVRPAVRREFETGWRDQVTAPAVGAVP